MFLFDLIVKMMGFVGVVEVLGFLVGLDRIKKTRHASIHKKFSG